VESSINQIWGTQNLILALIDEFSPSTIKLHKLLFIAQYGGFNLPSNLVFAPFLYGPFCVELSNEILPALQKEGLIQTIRYRKDQMSPIVRQYSLTELGKEMMQQWLASNTEMSKKYRKLIQDYQGMTTEEIISKSYDIFRKTIAPRLLYLNQQMLHERANQMNSRISEKIRLKVPLESNMISDPVVEFVLEDFRDVIPVFLSKSELRSALKDKLDIGAQVKVYGCFHMIKEDDSELIGVLSHHFHSKNLELTKENGQFDLICKLTKNDAEICYYNDFLGHVVEIGGIISEKNPLLIEPVYILGYYPREYQA
jgi:DNA-binding PadR family transcriptional regulator